MARVDREPTLAEELADLAVTEYLVREVIDPEAPGHTLVKAAVVCGCPSCVSAYISMVDFITQGDEQWSDAILKSNEVKRPHLPDWEAQG